MELINYEPILYVQGSIYTTENKNIILSYTYNYTYLMSSSRIILLLYIPKVSFQVEEICLSLNANHHLNEMKQALHSHYPTKTMNMNYETVNHGTVII